MRKGLGILLFGIIASANVFADDESLLLPNTTNQDACVADNTGVYETGFEMEPVYENITFTCAAGYYLPRNSETCAKCLANNYCPGGDYIYSTTTDNGITACPNNLLAPAGMSASTQCGRKLHIGDAYVYMHGAKKTTPSLNIDLEMDGTPDFFGNMTKIPVPMNIDVANLNANNKLVIEVNDDYVVNNETKFTAGKYYVYDDTMTYDFSTINVTVSRGYAKGYPSDPQKYNNDYNCFYTSGMSNRSYADCNDGNHDDLDLYDWKVTNRSSTPVIYGVGKVSAKIGDNNSDAWDNASSNWTATDSELDSATGTKNQCWCKLTGYKPDGLNTKLVPSNTLPWIYAADQTNTKFCVEFCSAKFITYPAFRSALLGQSN